MGFLRRLFRTKNPPPTQTSPTPNNRRKWSFGRSSRPSLSQPNNHPYDDNLDPAKHAIAVAAATAAVAEAALAAAQAAAEVVRLTGGAGGGRCASLLHVGQNYCRLSVDEAAVRIQSAFRAYLARRALRALKALVKLQAFVRGHFVRKRTADMLRRMQTLERVQARVRATRSNLSSSPGTRTKSNLLPSNSHQKVLATTSAKDRLPCASGGKVLDSSSNLKRCGSSSDFRSTDMNRTKVGCNWLDRWMEESLRDYHDITSQRLREWYTTAKKSDKILEVDTWKPHTKSQQSDRTFLSQQDSLNLNQHNPCPVAYDAPSKLSQDGHNYTPKVSSQECSQLRATKTPPQKDSVIFMAAENNPHVLSSSPVPGNSWRKDASSPSRSESAWGFLNGYSSYPNYMVNTESSRAKLRSQSVSRQRVEFEQFSTGKRYPLRSCDSDTSSERGFVRHTNIRGTDYPPPTSRLNRIGSANLSE